MNMYLGVLFSHAQHRLLWNPAIFERLNIKTSYVHPPFQSRTKMGGIVILTKMTDFRRRALASPVASQMSEIGHTVKFPFPKVCIFPWIHSEQCQFGPEFDTETYQRATMTSDASILLSTCHFEERKPVNSATNRRHFIRQVKPGERM